MKEDAPPPAAAKPYKAFISYSHAADDRLAPTLQSALQSFAKPWYRRRAVRVFRDRTNLSVKPDLWASIEEAVRGSEFFLLLASPEAARSEWVPREIEAFLDSNTSDRLLIVLTGGALDWDDAANDFAGGDGSAFPQLGHKVFRREPKWEDLSCARGEEHLSLRNPSFRDVVASISSTIRNIPLDEITGRDVLEHKKTKRIVRLAVTTLVALLAAVAFAAFIAYRQAGVANARRIAAESALLSARQPNLLGVSALLAAETLKRTPSIQAQETLSAALQLLPRSAAVVRHRGSVNAVAFTPDGRRLVTGGSDGRVLVSEVEGGAPVAEHNAGSPVRAISVSPDGRSVAAILTNDAVSVWSWEGGDPPLRFDVEGPVLTYAFSPDGKFIATTNYQGESTNAVKVYDLGRGELAAHFPTKPESESADAAAFSGGGEYLAVGGGDGTITLWSGWATKTPRAALSLKTDGAVNTIIFDKGARHVAAATSQDALHVWEVAGGREVCKANTDFVLNDIAYNAAGNYIAGGSGDETTRVWSAGEGCKEQAQLVSGGEVLAVAFGPEFDERFERYVATAGEDGTARLWDYSIAATHSESRERVRMPHAGRVHAVAFSPNGKFIATASEDGTARVWDFQRTPSLVQFSHPRSSRQYVAFSGERDLLLTAGVEGELYAWEPDGGKVEEGKFGAALGMDVALSPDGSRVATVNGRELVVRDTSSKEVVAETRLPGCLIELSFGGGGRYLAASVVLGVDCERPQINAPAATVVLPVASPGNLKVSEPVRGGYAVAVSADGAYAARFTKWGEQRPRTVGGGRSTALVWDMRAGRVLLDVETQAAVRAAAFSPDGRHLALGVGNAVELREMPSGMVLARMEHRDTVYAVAFSAGGEYIASTGEDATVRVWSAKDGAELSRTQATVPAWQLVFSSDGKYLATFGERSGARVWLWRPEDLLAAAAARLPANLSRDEWHRYVGEESYSKTFPNLPVPGE